MTDCNFADMELAVRWIVRGLPLITLEANQWIYKVIHPYSAASLTIFKSWPPPKQFASEVRFIFVILLFIINME